MYAEDPTKNFLPSPGKITKLKIPNQIEVIGYDDIVDSLLYQLKFYYNMFKQSYKILKRRKKLLKLGNISFEDYKKKFIKESKAIQIQSNKLVNGHVIYF